MGTKKPALDDRITVRMPKGMKRKLVAEAKREGYSDLNELVRSIVRAHQDQRKAAVG